MKVNKYLSFIVIITISIFSCNNVSSDIYGNWAVLEVYYNDNDISGINRSTDVSFSSSMRIDRVANIIQLPTKNDKVEYGKFSTFSEREKDFFKIYDSTDKRFDGVYEVEIEKISSENNGKREKFSIILQSDYMYIYGVKTETKF